jgi:hypothetical protein
MLRLEKDPEAQSNANALWGERARTSFIGHIPAGTLVLL